MPSSRDKDECPRCGTAGLKTWEDLTDEQRFLAERLPASADHTRRERKRHRFCPRCWYEETAPGAKTA